MIIYELYTISMYELYMNFLAKVLLLMSCSWIFMANHVRVAFIDNKQIDMNITWVFIASELYNLKNIPSIFFPASAAWVDTIPTPFLNIMYKLTFALNHWLMSQCQTNYGKPLVGYDRQERPLWRNPAWLNSFLPSSSTNPLRTLVKKVFNTIYVYTSIAPQRYPIQEKPPWRPLA